MPDQFGNRLRIPYSTKNRSVRHDHRRCTGDIESLRKIYVLLHSFCPARWFGNRFVFKIVFEQLEGPLTEDALRFPARVRMHGQGDKLQVKSYIQNGKRNLRILIEKKLQAETGTDRLK